MQRYKITFSAGPDTDICKTYDVDAENSIDAFRMAYRYPEASQRWKYTEISVSEIQEGPKIVGVRFAYTQLNHSYSQYLFIQAETEEQARRYYRNNIQGKRFWQPRPDMPDDQGNCVYGTIQQTYIAAGNSYTFDALE